MRPRIGLTDEGGFTFVELLVGVFVLAVGAFGLIAAMDSSRRLANSNESQTVRAQVAERELQSIIAQGYSNIGLSSAPAHSTDPNNPDYYVSTTSPPTLQWDLTNPARQEPLCTPSTQCTGSLSSGPTPWSSGSQSGSIYRYVTWVDDSCEVNCTTTADFKRVTVMVTQSHLDGPAKPWLLSALVEDPNA